MHAAAPGPPLPHPNCAPYGTLTPFLHWAVVVQVFKLPYVQRHLDRFKAEEQRRNLKQSTSISRRKQLLDAGALTAAGAGAEVG